MYTMQENTLIIGAYFQSHLFAINHIGVLMYFLDWGTARIFTRVMQK
jgi:hypothetical protein